ncbi:MAG: N-acetylglutaminylglutamine synthetase, partial [Chthoniobacterales bacterium]
MASKRTEKEDAFARVMVPCGWGRLVFAHTFTDAREVARELLDEKPGTRDIAFYVVDPQIILNTAPRDLFMDPSHSYRLHFEPYRGAAGERWPVEISTLRERGDITEINRIYRRREMVEVDAGDFERLVEDPRVTYFLARNPGGGEVQAVALGVDHKLAFDDLENGCSLWSLAVNPQATIPSLGEAMVRHLVEYYSAGGRSQMDLSVLHDNNDAERLYTRLGFERVPVFAIKRCNPINEQLFTGAALPEGFNPYAQLLIKEAARRGISVEPIHPEKGYFRLTLGGRSVTCRESLTDLTSAVAMSCCDDKEMTRRLLTAADLAMPAQQRANVDENEDQAFLRRHGRVVVKPARGEQGNGVAVDLRQWEEVSAAIERAARLSDSVLLEEYIAGQDLRVVVINNEVVAAAVRRPPQITGTGHHTVRSVIEAASRRRAAATGGESRIPLDAETLRCVAEAGVELDAVLEAGCTVDVRRAANLHTGGTIHDVTA